MKALFIIGVILFIWLATKNMMDFAKRGVNKKEETDGYIKR